jgi:hypothetical protein
VLRRLLDEGSRHDAEYGGGLSNHLPMALVALKRLGADDARLARLAAAHAVRLEPAPAAQAWPAGDAWASRLGDRSAWPVYRQLFAEWLVHEGAADTCQQVMPVLMAGCGAAAFHGLIRAAYALQAGHAGELADGLSYWACRHLPLGGPPSGAERDPAELLVALDRAAQRWAPAGRMISDRMRWVAAQPAFGRIADQLRVDDKTLPRLAELGARLYAATGDLTALHLVTSAHALRVVLSVLDDDAPTAEMVGHYWRAFAAAVASVRAAPRRAAPAPLPWPEIVAAALGSDDEHLIKLVDSCREQERALGGGMWRRAATRGVLQART